MFPNESTLGLSSQEVQNRQKQYGLNILPESPPPNKLSILIRQLKSPLVYVLIFAALITMAVGHYADAIIISLAVFINTILGFIQEGKASSALQALKSYVTNSATVIREGKRITIDTTQIVPGDVIVLGQGVRIPADGKLIFANRLFIDEALLTGESMPINKNRNDSAFMGTTISSGQAIMEVVSTGAKTKMGAIAGQIQETKEDTPLQRQLKNFSRRLVIVIVTLVTIVFILGIFHNFSLTEIFTTSVALAVSSIPEGLLVSLTVILAIGMQKILKHRGLVNKLSAAETLGGVTVICVDKTGTLTQGKMKVVEYVGNENQLAKQVLLANDLDDPIVIAAFEWGRTIIKNFVSKHQRLDSIPFSSKERFFVSLHKWSNSTNVMFVNGAPELLLNWAVSSDKEKEEIRLTIDNLTKQGKRIIGFAKKDVPLNKRHLESSDVKGSLTWVGMLAFSDPVRPGVKEAIDQAKIAGIKSVVITGDYPQTSLHVLQELGIKINKNEVMTGIELEKLTVGQLAQKVKSVLLFARTTPDQKLKIVEAMKKNGEVVAMMGDGVNDAPALHRADIGIVVGEATDVAKESADLVLLDSNFSTIVSAIEEGRAMFENIRKIILYLMSDAFAEIIIIIGSISIGLPLPLTAVQILWINLISDGFPGLALTIDPKRDNLMSEPPRRPQEHLVNKWMISLIALVSLAAGLITLSSFIVVYKLTGDVTLARSVAFVTMGLDSLTYVFSVRTLMVPFWKSRFFQNKWLILAVFVGFLLQIMPFTTPLFRQFFGISALSLDYWIIAAVLSFVMFFVIEIFKAGYNLNSVKKWLG